MPSHLLTTLLLIPLLGALATLLWPAHRLHDLRYIALVSLSVVLVLGGYLLSHFDPQVAGYQFMELHDWVTLPLGALGVVSIDYALALDGMNLPLVLLALVVMWVGVLSSWFTVHRPRAYFALYLLLTSSVLGCFMAQDFFLFYLFFEFMLLPMYFLIGLWGGPRREYAAIKFFIYTFVGSLLILVAMIGLYLSAIDPIETALALGLGAERAEITPEIIRNVQLALHDGLIEGRLLVHTFRFDYLMDPQNYLPSALLGNTLRVEILGIPARMLVFWLLFIGFAVKLPVVPLHTWLPDAHVEAPTPVSVVLAGILLKIGGYGFIRIVDGFFPAEALASSVPLALLGMISIVYGGFNALAQSDLKKLIAYSSVSHMGFVLLGVASFTAEGVNGAIFQMVSHGILSAMLFLLAGVLYDRTHDRLIDNYRGLIGPMPRFTILTGVAFFASLGLPGFSGFVGELFTLMGAFRAEQIPVWIAVLSTLGIVLAAGYFLWTLQRMFLGAFWYRQDATIRLADLTPRELIMLLPLALLALLLGLLPNLLFGLSGTTIEAWIGALR